MNKITKLLLGTTLLTAVSAVPAAALTMINEGATDFGNTIGMSTELMTLSPTENKVVVWGKLTADLLEPDDNADWFTFKGLNPGDEVWLSFNNNNPNDILGFFFDGMGPVIPGIFSTEMTDPFTLAGDTLTVGVVLQGAPSQFEIYHVTLEIHDVPEPSALALFGVGVAGLAAARRRRKAR